MRAACAGPNRTRRSSSRRGMRDPPFPAWPLDPCGCCGSGWIGLACKLRKSAIAFSMSCCAKSSRVVAASFPAAYIAMNESQSSRRKRPLSDCESESEAGCGFGFDCGPGGAAGSRKYLPQPRQVYLRAPSAPMTFFAVRPLPQRGQGGLGDGAAFTSEDPKTLR